MSVQGKLDVTKTDLASNQVIQEHTKLVVIID